MAGVQGVVEALGLYADSLVGRPRCVFETGERDF